MTQVNYTPIKPGRFTTGIKTHGLLIYTSCCIRCDCRAHAFLRQRNATATLVLKVAHTYKRRPLNGRLFRVRYHELIKGKHTIKRFYFDEGQDSFNNVIAFT